MIRVSPSLTLLQPPSEPVRRLPVATMSLLKLLSAFAREHPADLLARLLRDEAKRVLRWTPRTTLRQGFGWQATDEGLSCEARRAKQEPP